MSRANFNRVHSSLKRAKRNRCDQRREPFLDNCRPEEACIGKSSYYRDIGAQIGPPASSIAIELCGIADKWRDKRIEIRF